MKQYYVCICIYIYHTALQSFGVWLPLEDQVFSPWNSAENRGIPRILRGLPASAPRIFHVRGCVPGSNWKTWLCIDDLPLKMLVFQKKVSRICISVWYSM